MQRSAECDEETEASAWRVLATEAARRFGTPCYVSRWQPVIERATALESRMLLPVRSWLSFKTHPLPSLASTWAGTGRGVEVTSEFEMAAVVGTGCPVDLLLVNGVAKHSWLPRRTVPGLRVHFDSPYEAHEMAALAARDQWRVGLRCHVPAEHDRSDPRFPGQFGLARDEVGAVAALLSAAGVAVEGIHFHLGQGRRQPGDYGAAVDYIVQVCRENRIFPRYIDCGGGMGEGNDLDAVVAELNASVTSARRLLPSVEELWMENGRSLTERSAALVVGVLDIKLRGGCRYLICDGGRTNQALAADDSLHTIVVAPDRGGAGALTTIVGPTCMTDDRLGRARLPDTIERGDLIVWLDAGAYHLPWETRFSQGWCAVAWADSAGNLALARQRETPEEWASTWRA